MTGPKTYVGIHDDEYGGMTYLGGIIKDAWIFGLLPETETGAGWTAARLEILSEQVRTQWEMHGYNVSQLPPAIRERHARIHAAAIARARELGWDPDVEDEG